MIQKPRYILIQEPGYILYRSLDTFMIQESGYIHDTGGILGTFMIQTEPVSRRTAT